MEKQHDCMQLFRAMKRMADALYQSKLTGNAFFLILHCNFFIFLTAVRSWEMQFLTGKLIVFP